MNYLIQVKDKSTNIVNTLSIEASKYTEALKMALESGDSLEVISIKIKRENENGR